jgi:hypothetical protein
MLIFRYLTQYKYDLSKELQGHGLQIRASYSASKGETSDWRRNYHLRTTLPPLERKRSLEWQTMEGVSKVQFNRKGRKECAKITELKYCFLITLRPFRYCLAGSAI